MLSHEQLEAYRRMTPGERITLSLKMTAEQWPRMLSGTPEEIDQRFQLLNRENDLRNSNVLEKLVKTLQPQDGMNQ